MERPSSLLFADEPVEPFLAESYGQVLYFSRMKTVFTEMVGSLSHEQYREVYTSAYQALKQTKARACLVSQSRSFGSSFQDCSRLLNYMLPLLSETFPTKDFLKIGINDLDNNIKRWIADFLEKSFSSVAPFSVKAAKIFDQAMMMLQEMSSFEQKCDDYRQKNKHINLLTKKSVLCILSRNPTNIPFNRKYFFVSRTGRYSIMPSIK